MYKAFKDRLPSRTDSPLQNGDMGSGAMKSARRRLSTITPSVSLLGVFPIFGSKKVCLLDTKAESQRHTLLQKVQGVVAQLREPSEQALLRWLDRGKLFPGIRLQQEEIM